MPKALAKLKPFVVSVDIFKRDVLVCIGSTDEQVHRQLNGYEGVTAEDLSATAFEGPQVSGRVTRISNGSVVLRTRDGCLPGDPTLQHEIFHAACAVMDAAGITFSDDSDEAYAYCIGYLTEQINAKLRPLHKRRKSGTLRA